MDMDGVQIKEKIVVHGNGGSVERIIDTPSSRSFSQSSTKEVEPCPKDFNKRRTALQILYWLQARQISGQIFSWFIDP